MHGVAASLEELRRLEAALATEPAVARTALCLPATLIARAAEALGGDAVLEIGGQDCRAEAQGAFTGDVSAEMLTDAGATLVILGHSERRAGHGETDVLVSAKVEAALRAGLEPIVCVGETLEERRGGHASNVVQRQVGGSLPKALNGQPFSVAYEPVWAIGTGLTPSLDEIEAVHRAIREALIRRFPEWGASVPILYGGSVKPANAAEILSLPSVNGALVGGASLKADDFLAIVRAAP